MPDLSFHDLDLTALTGAVGNLLVRLVLVALVYAGCARALAFVEQRGTLSAPLVAILRRLVRWATGLAVLAVVLAQLGLLENAWASVTAVLAMLAIGFVAVWSVLSNALCSFIMLLARPFRVGDTVELPPDDIGGTVVNFNMLFTTLRADDDSLVQVPNNMFFQRVVRRRKGSVRIRLDDQLLAQRDATV